MQHAVPSRSVCVAYQGMTVPLPFSSLCGLSSSSGSSAGKQPRTPAVNSLSVSEERQKDSGIQSQFTSEMSCNGSTASSPVCTEKDIDIMERGELIHDDHQQLAIRDEVLEEKKVLNDHMPSGLELSSECLYTTTALPDTASLPVAAAYDTMDIPPPLASAEPLMSAELDDVEPGPEPPPALQSEKARTTSPSDQGKDEDPRSSVRSNAASGGWSQVGRGRTLMHILSTASRPVGKGRASAHRSIPEGQHLPATGPVFEDKETKAIPHTLTQPISMESGQGEALTGGQKAPRSSRKAKVSLAIKFQGAHASQHSAPESHSGIQNSAPASAPASQVCLKATPQVLMKPSEFRLPSAEYLHKSRSTKPEPSNAQSKGPGLAHTESEGPRIVPPCMGGTEEGVLHSQALSSDGDELDFVETRGGRSSNELEKSIAGHQRSIHRNQVCTHVYVSHVRAHVSLDCTIVPVGRAEEDAEEEQSDGGRGGRGSGRTVPWRTGGGGQRAGGYS